jgi:hypothetical protein
MNQKAIRSAHVAMQRACAAINLIENASSFEEVERGWSDFLSNIHRVFLKLFIGAKQSKLSSNKDWITNKENEREGDPLLKYINRARGADEHGLEEIVERKGTSTGIGGPGQSIMVSGTSGRKGTLYVTSLDGTPPVISRKFFVQLKTVSDRNGTYPVPTDHLGQPIPDATPLSIAQAATTYFNAMLLEAEKLP